MARTMTRKVEHTYLNYTCLCLLSQRGRVRVSNIMDDSCLVCFVSRDLEKYGMIDRHQVRKLVVITTSRDRGSASWITHI